MVEIVPFRVHFEGDDVPAYDTLATSPEAARDIAKDARPGELVRKVKRIRAEEMAPTIRAGRLPVAIDILISGDGSANPLMSVGQP